MRHSRLGITLILSALLVFAAAAHAQPQPEGATGFQVRGLGVASRFAIVTAHPLASEAGYEMLRRGGSAVDAAIAAQMVLGLVEPQSSGLGGGAFLVHYERQTRRVTTIDGREKAPATARADRFLRPSGEPMRFYEAVIGGRSVGVPGVLRALELAHKRYGRLPWRTLFDPAIRHAERGFVVSGRLAALLAREKWLPAQPAARAYFYRPDGSPLRAGDRLRNPALAATLGAVAQQGAQAFYSGEIASDLIAAVQGAPNAGDMTLNDLRDYRAVERAPVCGRYRSVRVCGMGPPSSGGIGVLQMLMLLEPFNLASTGPASPIAAHLLAEAGKLAFADREAYLADPDFVRIPLPGLLDRAYLARRAAQIRLTVAIPEALPGVPPGAAGPPVSGIPAELASTSHLSVIDRYGNALAMTTSVEDAFGSRLLVRGFLLNNQLTDFSVSPRRDAAPVANRVAGGKRPRSSMSPTLVFDRHGDPLAVLGSAGGPRIISYVAQAVVGLVDWNLDAQQAAAMPHVSNRNGVTEIEAGTAAEQWVTALRVLGHPVVVRDMTSGTQILHRRDGVWTGAADPRREGQMRGD